MTCQDGANAFYDSLKIRTGRVNRDKIELSSRGSPTTSFLSSRFVVFFFFQRFVERGLIIVKWFHFFLLPSPPPFLFARFLLFPFVSFRPSFLLSRILLGASSDTKTRTLGAQRILMHVFARVDVYFSSYF